MNGHTFNFEKKKLYVNCAKNKIYKDMLRSFIAFSTWIFLQRLESQLCDNTRIFLKKLFSPKSDID